MTCFNAALEIYDLFPEHPAGGGAVGPRIATADVAKFTVAPGHESAQTMAHSGSAVGVSGHPSISHNANVTGLAPEGD